MDRTISQVADFKNMSADLENMSIENNNNHHQPETAAFTENNHHHRPEIAAPELPDAYKDIINNCIGGCASEAVLVMQRPLYSQDVEESQLYLPGAPIKSIVTETEKRKLDEGYDEDGMIEVLFLAPSLCGINLYLEEDLNACPAEDFDYKGYEYGLTGYWNEVVVDNDLQEGMNVQLWSFRITSSNGLCFALVVL